MNMFPQLQANVRDQLSVRVLMPMMSFQQSVRPSRRAIWYAQRQGSQFRLESRLWRDEQKREWILDRLRKSLRYAVRHSAYYAELFAAVGFDPLEEFTFDDFSKLPTLDKTIIQQRTPDLVVTTLAKESLLPITTGGATGEPTVIYAGPEEQGYRIAAESAVLRRLGVPAGTSRASFWGHHLDPVSSTRVVDRMQSVLSNHMWIEAYRLPPDYLEEVHQRLEQFRPKCVFAYSSALAALADHVLVRGYKPSYFGARFVAAAEKLLPKHRELATAAFGCNVHEQYGARDTGLLGFQYTPEQSLAFETNWPDVLIEPEHESQPSAVLVTKLRADGMPMVRYRIGDEARFPAGSRPGHPCLSLLEVVGRDVDKIWLPKGGFVHGLHLPQAFKEYPVREFLVVQEADYSVDVQMVAGRGFEPQHESEIAAILGRNLPGVPLKVRLVESVQRTTSNKWRAVITKVVRVPQ
jgi:phenylacetate-CoA ligase